jgi:hypothetical protein
MTEKEKDKNGRKKDSNERWIDGFHSPSAKFH